MVPTRKLIQEVEKHRCLWDKLCAEYKDREAKEAAWVDIYRELNPNFDDLHDTTKTEIGTQITKKWYNVRDAYVKSLKSPRSRPYVYSTDMAFIAQAYGVLLSRKMSFGDKAEDDEDEPSEPWNEEFVDMDNVGHSTPAKRLKEETNYDENTDDSVVSVLFKLLQKEEDEDRAFFKSITPHVQSLSCDAKFEFRLEVIKLLRTLKSKDKKNVKVEQNTIDTDNDDSE